MNYAELVLADLRLCILKTLATQPGYSANDVVLRKHAEAIGIRRSNDVLRTELRYLDSLAALQVREVGEYLIATLNRRGRDHVDGLIVLEGVSQPEPGGK